MDRRHFLTSIASLAGGAALAPRRTLAQPAVNRAIVIGAGIVGSCIARELTKRGCEVVIIDKGLPASQASGNTFAWINAAYTNRPPSYLSLRQQALAEYRTLSEDVSFPIRWGGSLEWFQDEENERRLAADIAAFKTVPGAATAMIDAEAAAELEPNLDVGGRWRLAHSTNDGAVDAPAATQAIFDSALALGAQGVLLAEVRSIRQRRRSVRVRTTAGAFEGDIAVIAAGTGSRRLARMVDENVDTASRATPGVIVTTEPLPPLINTVLYPPSVHIHQLPDGRCLIGEKAGAPTTDVHTEALRDQPTAFPDQARATQHALRILSLAADYVPGLSAAKQVDVGIGWRPMPSDGLPIIGHGRSAQRVYFATMHSGVTLAPIVGRFAAREILDGDRVSELGDFRPGRFAE